MLMNYETLNQPPPLGPWDLYAGDLTLQRWVKAGGAAISEHDIAEFGRMVGTAEVGEWAEQANRHPPTLGTGFGHRVDKVEYHPAYHRLMDLSVRHGLIGIPWEPGQVGGHSTRTALLYLISQVEQGHCCPLSIGYAAVPSLRHQPELASAWEQGLISRQYDDRFLPPDKKTWVLVGMAMTERQGGSDVRANTSRAEPIGNGEYLLTGHKWFCSVPMSDAFLILAQAPAGLSCFLLPRFTPDGEHNRLFLQRLKDKLGNRSNASAEVEFEGAWARLVGEEGRGIATIIDMVTHTRLDCLTVSAGIMRRAVTEAVHHVTHRHAFGRALIEQPLMRNVIADLVLESEATTSLMMRVAASFDGDETSFRRIATAVAKYWACKRVPVVVVEALECLGGNGYVEESVLPRLYREAPLYGIWEGSGNVMCLDVLRALRREPETQEAFLAELDRARGADSRLDAAVIALGDELARGDDEASARRLVERMALTLQAALLVQSVPEVADLFLATRLGNAQSATFGTLPPGANLRPILSKWRTAILA